MSHLDYCNSLLFGVPDCLLWKMQCVQNMAAKLVLNITELNASLTRASYELHWLPILERIMFKILCLIFKCRMLLVFIMDCMLMYLKIFVLFLSELPANSFVVITNNLVQYWKLVKNFNFFKS